MAGALPDIVGTRPRLLICGTAVGTRLAAAGHYYADRGNCFWAMLHKLGATPRLLTPAEDATLPKYGIGLTDLAKNAAAAEKTRVTFDKTRLTMLVCKKRPAVLVFNGKKAAQIYLGLKSLKYGYQAGCEIGLTRVFVAPSTSASARRSWNENPWKLALAAANL